MQNGKNESNGFRYKTVFFKFLALSIRSGSTTMFEDIVFTFNFKVKFQTLNLCICLPRYRCYCCENSTLLSKLPFRAKKGFEISSKLYINQKAKVGRFLTYFFIRYTNLY